MYIKHQKTKYPCECYPSDVMNQGQQKQLLKDEAVAALFERYVVEVTN